MFRIQYFDFPTCSILVSQWLNLVYILKLFWRVFLLFNTNHDWVLDCFRILFAKAAGRPCSKRTTFISGPNYSIPAFTATWRINLLSAVGFCIVFPFLYSIHFFQYTIQKSNIPDAASQNINFGELFVRWVGGQKFSQFRKSHVDILLSPALPFGYGKHIPFNAEGPCCQHVVFDIRSPDIKTWDRSCKTLWKTSLAFKFVCLGEFLGSNVPVHRFKALRV